MGNISELAAQIVSLCTFNGLKIGFAESLTGGLISAEVVSVPGASACLEGSIVSYSNEVKIRVLGVEESVIRDFGAVSEQCAMQMAEGARRVLGTDLAVSVTGIAGPAGGSKEKPVGTVYIGFAGSGKNYARHFIFSGNRDSIRLQTVEEAFNIALDNT
ncbi:MAG: CinA family protein [Saccharofermentans sp.]|nr:CinA family protein [Saccharofermentans sp.]